MDAAAAARRNWRIPHLRIWGQSYSSPAVSALTKGFASTFRRRSSVAKFSSTCSASVGLTFIFSMCAHVDKSLFSYPTKQELHADPPTDDIEIQLIPEALLGTKKRDVVTLGPGKTLPLDEGIDNICLHYDWTYQPELKPFDVDSAVALFADDFSIVDFVWWDNPSSSCGSVRFSSADDIGEDHGRETISMSLKKIPNQVQLMATAVSVYSKDHTIQHLGTLGLSIFTGDGEDLGNYQVPLEMSGRSLLIGCFVRNKQTWEFQAMSDAMLSRTISEMLHEPENLQKMKLIKPHPVKRYRLIIQPVEGRDLTPMDFSLFTKRSDPYLKIFVDDKVVLSEITYATLNPKFFCPSLNLGEVPANSMKVIEIQCWDYDKITDDDNMGVIKVCLGGLLEQTQPGHNKIWLKLHPTAEHIEQKQEITGEVLLDVRVEEFV